MPRTDNDTWDLATSVGATATMVAAARAVATKADNPLINDQYGRATGQSRRRGLPDPVGSRRPQHRRGRREESNGKLQQMPDAMAVRTRFFDTFFPEATKAGIRQAVILAAGLDARAYRLEWPAGMTVFEVDQPEVIAFKTETLAELGATPTTDRRTVAIDLRNDWPAALAEAGFDRASRPHGSPKVCSATCRPKLRIACWTTSLRSAPTAAGWPPRPSRTRKDVDEEKVREMMRKATDQWRTHGFDLDFDELGYQGDRNDVADYMDGLGWRRSAGR